MTPKQIDELLQQVQKQTEIIAQQAKIIEEQAQTIEYLKRKLFGSQSEKIDSNQLSLLDEDDGVFTEPEQTGEENQTDQVQPTKKRKRTRQEILNRDLPVKITFVDVENKQCPHGHRLVSVGERFVREQLYFQPAKLYREEIYAHTYKCVDCEKIDGLAHLIQAQVPKPIIPHSLGSASVIAEIVHQKYEQGVPLNRQLKDWLRLGADLSDTTLANWIIKASKIMKPLYNLIREQLVKQPYLQGDETPLQVLREPGKKATSRSYMWVVRTIRLASKQTVFYAYADSRSGEFAQSLYEGFEGVLQCDGYSAYNNLEDSVTRLGCFAHARRKFYDADVAKGKISRPLELLNQMFILEKKWQKLSLEDRQEKRDTELRKPLQEFWDWVDASNDLPKSAVGKAVTYARNQRAELNGILEHSSVELSNNAAERSMKSLVIGRKNWLFSTSPAGAEATAIWMTLIESAKVNNVDPRDYITYLLENISQLPEFAEAEDLVVYLPWNFNKIIRGRDHLTSTTA